MAVLRQQPDGRGTVTDPLDPGTWIWRLQELRVLKKTGKQRRLGSADGGIIRRKAKHQDHICSVDFFFDRTTNGHFGIEICPGNSGFQVVNQKPSRNASKVLKGINSPQCSCRLSAGKRLR